jgi:hypothetical protein
MGHPDFIITPKDARGLTHTLEYEWADGTWHAGYLAYTLSEARGVARESAKRTGLGVRIVAIERVV